MRSPASAAHSMQQGRRCRGIQRGLGRRGLLARIDLYALSNVLEYSQYGTTGTLAVGYYVARFCVAIFYGFNGGAGADGPAGEPLRRGQHSTSST